ncbi:HEAT repeat domain-containing protein [Streptomyces californicus]|uniref:HEAT repeat domain-containing protein n=1 Tax=Streptomyces californicus TaxID=67351 RepID=UPI00296F8710|nr:HEAT repeat domain-containing protein [Streptomyces californicus]MDW4900227.1 HEAT repeat domain-containing protein [Streptomyces californicus]
MSSPPLGEKCEVLRVRLRELRDRAGQARKRTGSPGTLNSLETAVRRSGMPGTTTFSGQRVSSWAPPLDKPGKFVVPQDGEVLLAVVAVWSAWCGKSALDARGRVDPRWLRTARPEWDRLLEDARTERATSRERGDEEARGHAAITVYLGRVRAVHRRLNLDVLGPSGLAGEQPVIELRQVFMPQACRPFVPHLEEGVRRRLLAAGELVDDEALTRSARELEREEAARRAVVQPVLSVLAQESGRRLVVLGDPGAGKSTLAKYVTLALAGGLSETPPALKPLDGLVPVLVELRQYAQPHWRERTIEEFLDHVHVQERMGLPRAVLDSLLESGRAVVVFDGLDEIFDPDVRAQTARRITAFAAHYRRVRTVVTSREYGYRSHEFTANNFTQVMLQNLDPGQIETFIRRWYAAAHPDKPQLADQLTERLLSAVRTVRPVAELAGSPLLLTILAAIGMGRTIPRERREVYAHAIDVLVERWDRDAKFLPPPASPTSDVAHALEGLTAGRRVKLLERIARAMQAGAGKPAGTFIHHDDLIGIVRGFLTESNIAPPAAEVAARLMVDHLRSRNFLLAHYGGGLYGFVHRTFLEYLAATDLLRRREEEEWTRDDLIDLLAQQAQDSGWHEVLLLMAGGLKQRDVAALLARLLELHHRDATNYSGVPMLVLAVKVLAETADIGAPYVPGTSDPHLSVAAQSDAVIDALIAALQDFRTSDLQDALPALGTFGHFWSGRDRYMRWYWAQGAISQDFLGSAGAVAVALSRTLREAMTLFHASRLGDATGGQAGSILAALGERWSDRPEVFDTVLQAATRGSPAVRRTALATLGKRWSGRPEVFDTVLQAASGDDLDVRHAALVALGERWSDRPGVFATVLMAATSGNAPVRRTALATLGKWWSDRPGVFDLFLQLASGDNVDVRRTALVVLGERWSDRPGVFDTVLEAATGDELAIRFAAMGILGERWSDRPEVLDMLLQLVTSEDPHIRIVELDMLGVWLDRSEVFDAVLGAATRGGRGVRPAAIDALGRWWPDRAEVFATVLRAAADGDLAVQHTAIDALGSLWPDRSEVFDAVLRAATSGVAIVRRTALDALGRWWPERPEVFATVLRAAGDDDPAVRRSVLGTLGRWWPERPEVFATVLRAAGDDDPAVRRTALGTLGRRWPDRAEVFATVLRATGDDDPLVPRTAVSVLAHRYANRSRRVLIELAAGTGDDDFRIYLVRVIALVWPDEPDARQFLEDQAAEGRSDRVRATARRALEYVHLRSSLGAEEGASTTG